MNRRNIFQTAFAAIVGPRVIEAAPAATQSLSAIDKLFLQDAEILRNGIGLFQKVETDQEGKNWYGVKWGDGQRQISPEFWADNFIEAQDAARTWAAQAGRELHPYGFHILP
jgi:hypothetical protein